MGSGKNRDLEKKRRPQKEEEGESGEVLGVKKTSAFKNPNNKLPLGIDRAKKKKNNKEKHETTTTTTTASVSSACLPASEQLSFFLNRFQSATGIMVSSLELEPIKDSSVVELSPELDQDAEALSKHMKASFGKSWKECLYEGQLSDGNVDPGSPAVLVISISALRSLELLRGLRPLTQECRAAKLFAKHMKVEEQVSMLKSRVNIASGTPSRIKKLIDIDALGLSRLSVILMDMHTDAKGYSLFTLPQVSDEFWDLYKSHFHHRVVQGDLRICLYGPIACPSKRKSAVTKVPVTNEV